MKSKLIVIRNILFFTLLYYVIQLLGGIAYVVYYSIVNFKSISTNEFFMENCSASMMAKIFDITLIAAVMTFGIYVLVLRNKEDNLWKRCNFKKINGKTTFKVILVTIGAAAFSGAIVVILQDQFQSYNKINEAVSAASYSPFSMMAVILLLPIFEEILFRGLILYELNKKMSLLLAAIIQGILFGIYHMNILQSIYTAILGIVLGLIYIWTKSIVASIIAHIVYNFLGTTIMPLGLALNENLKYPYIICGLAIIGVLMFSLYKDSKDGETNMEYEKTVK